MQLIAVKTEHFNTRQHELQQQYSTKYHSNRSITLRSHEYAVITTIYSIKTTTHISFGL